MRRVTIFAPNLFHMVETMAYFLAMGGADVCVATEMEGDEKTEHPWCLRRLQRFGDIEIAESDGTPQRSDILVFVLVQNGKVAEPFARWRAKARRAAYLPSREGRLTWREFARQVVRSFPHYLIAEMITFVPYVHPQFLFHPDWTSRLLGSFDAASQRRFRICFSGCRQPPERSERLDQCRKALVGEERRTYWHDYTDVESTGPRGVDPMEYLNLLTEFGFLHQPSRLGRRLYPPHY